MRAEFEARVSPNGHVIWRGQTRVMEFFRAIAGKRIKVIVEEPDRSADQNRWFHAIFQEFSERTGYTPAQAKEFLKDLYIEDGRGTSELSITEGSDFGSFCESWIAENLR